MELGLRLVGVTEATNEITKMFIIDFFREKLDILLYIVPIFIKYTLNY